MLIETSPTTKTTPCFKITIFEDMPLKFILPILFFVYVFLLVFLPAIRVYRKTGIWPIRTKNEKALHEFTAYLVKVLFALLFVSIFAYCLGDAYYQWLKPIELLQTNWSNLTGGALLILSLLWIMIAQYQMGDSWRVGIDDQNKTELVVKGLYHISRNPIYLGLMTAIAGFFLLLPNMLTFAILLCAWFIVSIQIRIEEDFLLQQHGPLFSGYMKQVRRWI
jgi:protein-S-isoprenylcysteine O-methyltransferase Ste14